MNVANALRNVANAFENNFSALENVANGLKYVVMRCQCIFQRIFQRIFDLSLMPGFRKEGHIWPNNPVGFVSVLFSPDNPTGSMLTIIAIIITVNQGI